MKRTAFYIGIMALLVVAAVAFKQTVKAQNTNPTAPTSVEAAQHAAQMKQAPGGMSGQLNYGQIVEDKAVKPEN